MFEIWIRCNDIEFIPATMCEACIVTTITVMYCYVLAEKILNNFILKNTVTMYREKVQ